MVKPIAGKKPPPPIGAKPAVAKQRRKKMTDEEVMARLRMCALFDFSVVDSAAVSVAQVNRVILHFWVRPLLLSAAMLLRHARVPSRF